MMPIMESPKEENKNKQSSMFSDQNVFSGSHSEYLGEEEETKEEETENIDSDVRII